MHNKLRIGLFLALLLLPFAVFAQEDDSETAPTGKIAYVNPTELSTGGELYLLDLDNRNQATRISPEGDDRKDISPIFSPNGERIAFQSNGRLAFTTPSGGEPIVTDIIRSRHIAWASDNSRVAFLTPNADRFNLNVFSVDTNELKTYENALLFINDPATPTWSLDGTTIFFSAFEPEKNGDIYSISADFETLTNITNSPDLAESSPSVSPNGLFISYKVEFDGAGVGDVWVMGVDGSNPRNLTNGGLILGSPDTRHWWSPDSTRVMIPDAGRGIAIINTITGEITDFEGENPTWSPDGLWVAYTRFRVNRDNITYVDLYVAPANAPNENDVVNQAILGSGLSWQPDPSIEFEIVEIPSPTPSATDTPSVPQSVIESVLVEGQQSSWYFDGDADLAVTIIVQSNTFDTIAQLYTLDGGLLIENDDFDGTNSQIDFTLPDEAVYQVVITSFYGDASGDYTLSVVGIEGDLREKPQGGRFIATPTPSNTPTPTATATATLRPTSTHTPTATFTPTITPSPTFGFDRAQCPANLPPRLAIDTRGRVLPGGTSAVYEQPLTDSTQLGEIPGGVSFTVLDGPVCTDNFIWWQVEYRDITGWTIEAGAGEYFLEPLRR